VGRVLTVADRPFPVVRDVRFKLPLDVEQTLAFQGHRPICDFGLVYLRADGLDHCSGVMGSKISDF